MSYLYYVVLAKHMSMSLWFVNVLVVANAAKGFENSTNVGRDELKVMSFHPESYEGSKATYNETASWGKLESVLKLPESYTICSSLSWPNNDLVEPRVFFTLLGQDGSHFLSVVTFDYDTESLFSPLYFLTGNSKWRRSGNVSLIFPKEWVHSCVALSTNSSHLHLHWVVNGISVENTSVKHENSLPKFSNGSFILGNVDVDGNGHWISIPSNLTALNIFNSTLPLQEMQTLTRAQSKQAGSESKLLLGWREMQWSVNGGVSIHKTEKKNLFGSKFTFTFLNQTFANWYECSLQCLVSVGGRIPSVVTKEQWNALVNFLSESHNDKYVWMSVGDFDHTGVWKDGYTEETINEGHLVKNDRRPIVALQRGNQTKDLGSQRLELELHGQVYGVCSPWPKIRLRGLCLSSQIDRLYTPMTDVNRENGTMYTGYRKSMLSYNEEKTSKVKENVLGKDSLETRAYSWIINESSNTLVHMMNNDTAPRLGKLRWTVLQGPSICNKKQNESLDLMLTICDIGNFTCNNGECIPFQKRCNGINDCKDESDEEECKILVTVDKISSKT